MFHEYDEDDAALDAETQAEIDADLLADEIEALEPKVDLNSAEEREWRASLGLDW